MISPRSLLLLTVVLAGCNSEQPTFDQTTAYSADSLANELAIRLQDASPSPPSRPKSKEAAKSDEKAQEKSKAATKSAQPEDLDAIVADIAAKAATVPGSTRSEVLKAVSEKISADPSIKEAKKTEAVAKLNALAGE